MTDWTQRNLRKTYKWAYLMLGERPGTAITVSPDEHGAPSFKFARGRDEWTWSVEHGQLIATNVGESSESVVVPLAKSEQRTKQVMPLLLTIGESTLTNQFQGAMRSSTEIDATVEAWRLVGEYAAHKGVVPTTVMLPGGPRLWRVADLSFFTSGLVQNRSGQLLDMARAGRVTTVRNVLLGALDRFAHDGSSDESCAVSLSRIEFPAADVVFVPGSQSEVVLSSSAEEPLWWDLDTQSEVQPLRIGAGRAVFWWGKDQTWLVTSNARALQWPPKGPAQPVDLPTITNNGPCKIPLAGTKGMLAWGDASEVRVRESEPEAELRMEGGNARTDTYEVGNGVTHLLAKETSRYLARVDGGTSVWFLDRSSKQARWTSSGSLHGGHPYSGAIHPTVPLVATFSGCIALFDLEAAEHIEDFAGPNELGSKWEGEFSPDGRFLVLRSGDHLFAMDLITRAVRLLLSVPGASRGDSVRGAMTFSPDGRFLVVATGGHAYAIEWSQLEGLWNRSPWVRMVRPVQTL